MPKAPAKKSVTSAPKVAPKVAKVSAPKKAAGKASAKVLAPKAAKNAPAKAVASAPKLGTYFYACGKRKTATALVRMFPNGKGIITINQRTFENYFPVFTDQDKVMTPLRLGNALKQFDIVVKVFGGGIHAQAEAIRHGISRALLEYNAELRSALKPAGLLTRDSRVKERKKYGLHRARRAPQFSKR